MNDVLEVVRAAGPDAETHGRLPDHVVEVLREAGLLRMAVPETLGGTACSLPELLRRLTLLAAADSSTGWLVMVWTQAHVIAARLAEDRYIKLFAQSPDVILAATSAGSGTARPVDDGFEVSGEWRFVSGSSHATGVLVHCDLMPAANGRRIGVLVPARSLSTGETWSTLGLRATASNGVHADRVRVHTADMYELDARACPSATPHSHLPFRPSFALHMGAIAVGNAWAALRCDGARQHEVAMADDVAASESADEWRTETLRLALDACAQQIWERACSGRTVDDGTARWMSELGTYAVQTSLDVILGRYRVSGSSVVFDGNPLQRRLRDALTMSQHANVSRRSFSGQPAAHVQASV